MNDGARAGLIWALAFIGALAPAALRASPPKSPQETAPPGRVVDQASGAAIAEASVTWMPPQAAGPLGDSGEGREPVSSNSFGGFPLPESWGPGGTIEVTALGYLARTLTWEEAAAAKWRLELARDPLALDEVVVTASVRARRRSEIALPVESIEASEIAAAGAASADRLLEELPGVQVTGNAPTGSNLLIRGIGGARVLVLLDGQPVTGTLIENRDLSRMSLAGSDRVEIVKGPLSSLYGSDALGGVVNVITRLPASGFRLDARALSGGAGRQEAEATASGGGRLQYSITGGWRQENQVPGLVSGARDAFARVWDGRSRFRFAVTDDWELRAGFTYLRERQRWPVGGGFSGFNDNRGFSGWLETRRRAGQGEWSATVFAQDYEHLYRSARGGAPIGGDRSNAQWERLARVTTGYSGTRGDHDFDMGIEGAARAIESPDKLVEDRASDDQLAFFVQDAWRLGATVVSGGARLTRNSRWGSNLAPSLGTDPRTFGESLRLRAARRPGLPRAVLQGAGLEVREPGGGRTPIRGPSRTFEPERSWNVSGRRGMAARVQRLAGRRRSLHQPHPETSSSSGSSDNAPSGLARLLPAQPGRTPSPRASSFHCACSLWDDGEFSAGYAYLDAHTKRTPAGGSIGAPDIPREPGCQLDSRRSSPSLRLDADRPLHRKRSRSSLTQPERRPRFSSWGPRNGSRPWTCRRPSPSRTTSSCSPASTTSSTPAPGDGRESSNAASG